MAFVIRFETDNAAFEDDFTGEVERVLLKVIEQRTNGRPYGVIHDVNGNSIGKWESDDRDP